MKKFLFTAFMLVMTVGFSLSAQTDISYSQANTRLRSTASNNTKGPRMPLEEWIDCCYDNGLLFLSSSDQTIIKEVIIIDNNNNIVLNSYLNNSYEIVPVIINSGAFLIRCFVENGCEYEGYLYIP